MKTWLSAGWDGDLKPIAVIPLSGEDADGRAAWFFHLTFPNGDTPPAQADRAVRLLRMRRNTDEFQTFFGLVGLKA